jgi:hypothetical protein
MLACVSICNISYLVNRGFLLQRGLLKRVMLKRRLLKRGKSSSTLLSWIFSIKLSSWQLSSSILIDDQNLDPQEPRNSVSKACFRENKGCDNIGHIWPYCVRRFVECFKLGCYMESGRLDLHCNLWNQQWDDHRIILSICGINNGMIIELSFLRRL